MRLPVNCDEENKCREEGGGELSSNTSAKSDWLFVSTLFGFSLKCTSFNGS